MICPLKLLLGINVPLGGGGKMTRNYLVPIVLSGKKIKTFNLLHFRPLVIAVFSFLNFIPIIHSELIFHIFRKMCHLLIHKRGVFVPSNPLQGRLDPFSELEHSVPRLTLVEIKACCIC